MKLTKRMSRRTVLRGAGTVAIGLPFIDAMHGRSGYAQPMAPPVRAFNCSFGLGLFSDMQTADFSGPLEPLKPLASKLLRLRGVSFRQGNYAEVASAAGNKVPNSHLETTCFTGTRVKADLNRAGGASLDQALRRSAYPKGLPAGMLSTVQAGLAYEGGVNGRVVRCWNPDGTPASSFIHRADLLFDRIFGSFMPSNAAGDPDDAAVKLACRRRRSVLDAVVAQYQHYTSPASNLGRGSRAKIRLHLEQIREVEQRVFAAACDGAPAPPTCKIPAAPANFVSGEQSYVDISVQQLVRSWRLLVDLFVAGLHCDQFRFGALVFLAQGARIRLTGSYDHAGRRVYDFDDARDWGQADNRENKTSHEFWHAYGQGGTVGAVARKAAAAHAHLMMREVAYFLQRLDDTGHLDENGGTLLQNAMVTVGTEAGSGNHDRAKANEIELRNVFHAISGGGGRFRSGVVDLGEMDAVKVYNTMLQAYGVKRLLGSGAADVTGVRV